MTKMAESDQTPFTLREILLVIPAILVLACVVVGGPLLLLKFLGFDISGGRTPSQNYFLIGILLETVQLTALFAYLYRKLRGTSAPWRAIGFRRISVGRALRYAALGFGVTLVVLFAGIIAVIAAMAALHGGQLPESASGRAPNYLPGLWADVLLASIFAPVLEEILFRGLLLEKLLHRMRPWLAVAVSSLLFAVYHLDPLHALTVLPAGIVIGVIYVKTRSVWPGILLHGAWNLMATLVLYLS